MRIDLRKLLDNFNIFLYLDLNYLMIQPFNHIADFNNALTRVLKVDWILLAHNKAFIKSPSTI